MSSSTKEMDFQNYNRNDEQIFTQMTSVVRDKRESFILMSPKPHILINLEIQTDETKERSKTKKSKCC
jgi:hypothetical protein